MDGGAAVPRATLSVLDGTAMMVGVVIGIGIFKTPPLVAAQVDSEAAFIAAWALGGLLTLIGALVYGELAAAFPDTGGEYHFLKRAFGQRLAFLFAWARISVIQTGAIAAVAFVFGDYAQQLLPLGPYGASFHAATALAALTLVNLLGTFPGKRAQNLFAALTLAAVLLIALAGLASAPAPPRPPAGGGERAAGLAMIFILLTYGGWNEAAYLSAEVRDPKRNMGRVLVLGTAAVAAVYLLVNLAYLHVLGLQALRDSQAVAADMMRAALGPGSALALSAAVCCAALSTLNASIFTGARIYHALGEDLASLRRLGAWNRSGNNPRTGLLVQSAVALALIGFGTFSHDGFQVMVEYTAPVFWLFLLLVGLGCFRLRGLGAASGEPFRGPLRLARPAVFSLTAAWLFYASLVHTGPGALLGLAVLLLGLPLLFLLQRHAGGSAAA